MRSLLLRSVVAGLLCAALAGIDSARAATLVVTNTADSGTGSLRATIAAATDGDLIQFDPALNGQTISLTTAELAINKNITISGPGPDLLSVSRSSGAPRFRIFHISTGRTVAIQNITISGGLTPFSDPGGGVFNDQATLSIDHCTVSNNQSIGGNSGLPFGGGVYNTGTLAITNSFISNNSASIAGGGISNHDGVLTITDTTVGTNTSTGSAHLGGNGGGIDHAGSGMLTIRNSSINSNVAGGDGTQGSRGGGIYSTGPLTMSDSTVSGNSAVLSAGGIYQGGTTTMTHCTINSNSASDRGAGIYSVANLTLTDSTVSGNHTGISFFFYGYGGGIYHGGATLMILSSTINDNRADGGDQASEGGGIYSQGSGLSISNSTFSGNFGRINGGAISNKSPLTITNCTFSSNSSNGAGGGIISGGSNVIFQVGNTLLKAGSSGANIVSSGSGTITSLGYNLSSDNGGGFLTAPGDQINTDPILGPLQDNGGPTFTYALLPGSPAINTGSPDFTPPPLYDQRGLGYDRVVSGRIDIGSFEVQPSPSPTPTPTPSPTPTPCPIFNVSGTVGQCTAAGPSGVALAGVTMTLTSTGQSTSTTTDSSGNYFLSGFSCVTNTVTPSKAALAPGSPGIDTVDVITLQKHFLIIGPPVLQCRAMAADVNGVGGVNTVDVIATQRFFLGLTTGIANVGRYQFLPASRSYSPPISDQPAQNYDTIVFGDVAPPYAAP